MNENENSPSTDPNAEVPSGAEAEPSPAAEAAQTSDAPDAAASPTPDPVAALQAEVAELKDKLLRALADTENLRRRAEREKQETMQYAIAGFAKDLLSVADTFRRALDSLSPEARQDEAAKAFIEGVELTERELQRVFEKHGIRQVTPNGEKFDHNFHQAMMEVPTDDHAPGTVVNVMQTGYVLNGRLLRPALVGVAKAANPDAPAARVDTKV
jgi:molecular chaperone GrpE